MSDNRDDFIIAIRFALLKKGAKQKFSLFFLILLSILIITLDKFSLPIINSTRAALNDFVYHISIISSQPSKLRKFLVLKTKNHYNVVAENEYLKKEIEFFKKQKFKNAYLASENQVLKKVLDISNKKEFEQNFSVAARVVLDQTSPYLKSILISKGTKSGIEKGMTVFSRDYLIGIIIEANYITSRVLLLTDLNSKIPIVIENTDINGILEGLGSKGNLQLSYLPSNFKIEKDKIIFSSGKDGFLVPGVPIAKTYLNKKNKILIRLLGDPDQALIVHVTKGQVSR
jgi:rod shape-determining protein MreC